MLGSTPSLSNPPLTLLGVGTVIAATVFSQLSLALCQQWAIVNGRGNEASRNGGTRREAKCKQEWEPPLLEGISLTAMQHQLPLIQGQLPPWLQWETPNLPVDS